jgi:hypothetical protein
MILPSAYSVIRRNCAPGRPPWVTATAALVIGATAAVAATGCSSGGDSKATGKGTEAVSTESRTTSKALELAAADSSRLNSLTANLSVHSSGAGAGTLTGTVKMQLKPRTITEATFNVTSTKSRAIHLDEILTGTAIYFKDPAFTRATGKQWVEATIAELSSTVGVSLGSLLQNLESSNPIDQARLFSASRNAHVAGSAIIGGVATVEYAGTYSPAVALTRLPAKLRPLMGPALRSMGADPVQFEAWVDANHIVRRVRALDNVHGQVVTTNLDITSVGKPVRVTLPAPGDVAPLPKI